MTIGQQTFEDDARVMLRTALDNGITEFDAAYVYNDGACETILGELLPEFSGYRIATKAHPRVTGKLDRAAIRMQLTESLRRLRMDSVDVLYLHFPDHLVSMEERLSACQELYEEGRFRELGVSNFTADEVREISELAASRGWVRPSVYEGMYNLLNRNVEGELFSAVRDCGLRFTAYNPLAGGLLTGKYSSMDEKPETGRFAQRPSYQKRYWKDSTFHAVEVLRSACAEAGISMAETVLRWLANHSELCFDKGDAIILGASRPEHLVQNIQASRGGALPAKLAQVCDSLWDICKADAQPYYTYYN